jgi:hypothetical protein
MCSSKSVATPTRQLGMYVGIESMPRDYRISTQGEAVQVSANDIVQVKNYFDY